MSRNWSRERWRKLTLIESAHKGAWSLLARALEPYFIKRARDDGFLAYDCQELLAALHPHQEERDLTERAIDKLLQDRFLEERAEGVFVRNLPRAQGDEVAPEEPDVEPLPAAVPPKAPPPPKGEASTRGRWANTTSAQRAEAARKAADARWGRKTGDASTHPVTHGVSHGALHGDASSDASTDASGVASGPRAFTGQDILTEQQNQPVTLERGSSETHARDASTDAQADAATHDALTDIPPSPRGASSATGTLRKNRAHLDAFGRKFMGTPDPRAFPDDFEPSAENVEQAKAAGLVLADEVTALRRHAQSNGKVSCAWHAELGTWMSRSARFNRERGGQRRASGTQQPNLGLSGWEDD